MASITPTVGMSPPPAAAGGHVSVGIPPPAAAAACGNPEKQLSHFVRCVAFGEWAGNAFRALAFLWATGVLLGGFCSSLKSRDFWFATVMIFIEALRIFSRSYKLDSQSLFGTTRALRWINSSFPRMLWRPQEGNEVVVVMGLWLNLVEVFFSEFSVEQQVFFSDGDIVSFVVAMPLLIRWSRRPRRPKLWQLRALAICYLLYAISNIIGIVIMRHKTLPFLLIIAITEPIIDVVAVLLLNLRPRRVTILTSTPCGRRLILLAKVTSALWLVTYLLLCIYGTLPPTIDYWMNYLERPFAILVLSLGSLQQQNHAADSHRLFGRCTDAILHTFFLFHFMLPFPMFIADVFLPHLSTLAVPALSVVVLLALLLIGNLQIPAAVAQIVLSSLRLINLAVANNTDYHPLPRDSSPNMVTAIAVFYVLALCQGSLYIMASFLGLLSSFPRRWLIRKSKFGATKLGLGAKAVDLYYERAYAARMEMGVFGTAAGSSISFADFAINSLSDSSASSSSRDLQVAGLFVLHNILLERRSDCCTRDLILRVTSGSGIAVLSTLIGMLAWATDLEEDGYTIRLLAARVIAELASSLRISSIPGMLRLVSSLLNKLDDDTNAVVVIIPNQQGGPSGTQQTPLALANGGSTVQQLAQGSRNSSNGGWRSWAICRFWKRMKDEYCSAPLEPAFSLTHQDSSLAVLGMVILEKLARDIDNCAEILKDDTTNLISKTIEIIGYASSSDNKQDDALVCSSLEFLRRLATTGERIGAALRHELWNHPFLLTCVARVLEDDGSSSSSSHQAWEPAMDIIAKLALHSPAGPEIGRNQVITASLLRAFLGRHGPTNVYYDQSLRKVSGEALANLAMSGTANCLAILEETGYHVIIDPKDMLYDEDYRYAAARLLLNLCAHYNVNLLQCHPHSREHLSSALTTVMEHIMVAEGKQLESRINLAFEIGDVVGEAFVRELDSQTNSGAELVQKLLCTLNSKKIPNPEYPRMRRVILRILISILELCHHTVEKLMEEGMMERLMESLTKIVRSPSRVEEYRVFYGNIGVVLEDGEPMPTLVARAKTLLIRLTTHVVGAPTGNHL